MSEDVQMPRYRAVRAEGRGHPMLKAAIEDTVKREVIRVSDPPMAFYLAKLLNAVDRGEPLPPAGEQHHPSRFQVTHDATGLTSAAAVVFIQGSSGRMIAAAPSDERARVIARLLNRIDYPMISGGLVAKTGVVEPAPGELPEPSVLAVPEEPPRERRAGFLLVLLLPVALILASVAVVGWLYAVIGALAYAVFAVVMYVVVRRA